MTLTATELLLEATGISKAIRAVVALKSASLAVRRGGPRAHGRQRRRQEHARQDPDRCGPAGQERFRPGVAAQSTRRPSRRVAVVSVYTRPALIPDLDIRSNRR